VKRIFELSALIAVIILEPSHALASDNLVSTTDPLSSIAIFASTYITGGANSTFYGNVVSGAGLNTGAGSFVTGNITSIAATTLGGSTIVTGGIVTGAATTVGANSSVSGAITSGAAATIGASSFVAGDVAAYGAIAVDTSSSVGSRTNLPATAAGPTNAEYIQGLNDYSAQLAQSVVALQAKLTALGTGTLLPATYATPLLAGVYSTPGFLATAAGTTILLDAQGLDNQSFIFNIGTYLTTGASTSVTLINPGLNNTVYWNVGTYVATGTSTMFSGTIVANGYISIGANNTVLSSNPYSGGLYSINSYVVSGADSVIGRPVSPSPVPEPAAWAMMVIGLGAIGTSLRSCRQDRRTGAA
jgi:predicted acyltransferase (DUF342 family)